MALVVDENPELLAETVDPEDVGQTKPRASKSAHKDMEPKDSVALPPLEAERSTSSKRLNPSCVQRWLPCRRTDLTQFLLQTEEFSASQARARGGVLDGHCARLCEFLIPF